MKIRITYLILTCILLSDC